MNWFDVVFNNLYNRLQDLFASTKPSASKDNIEFKTTQMVGILLWIWFLVDSTFVLPKVYEDEVGVARPLLGASIEGTNIVLTSCF